MKEYSEEELRLLTEVLPNVGTELRDAMTNLRKAVSDLAPTEAQESDPKLKQSAAVFMHGYCRMLRMIGNLTEAETLAADTKFELRNVDIAGLCREMCEKAEALFEMKDVTLAYESDRMGCVIGVDEEKIKHLLLNLLSNALRYTPAGGTVTVRVNCGVRFVHISVADTGCGIAPDKLETVFDRFLHAELLDSAPHGIGLGLAICRRIAQGHGGRIVAESSEGGGATFTVSLPRVTAKGLQLRMPSMDYAGGLDQTLVELSDALPTVAFTYLHLD